MVALALEPQQGVAETYAANMSALDDTNAPQLIALPPNLAALPGVAGSVGFPDAYFPTNQARPANEGALS